MAEKILTLHPEGKQGVNIDRARYDQIRSAIRAVLSERGEISFSTLADEVSVRLAGQFDGSIPWYTVTVKLDLEARGIIRRVPGTRPQLLQLDNYAKTRDLH